MAPRNVRPIRALFAPAFVLLLAAAAWAQDAQVQTGRFAPGEAYAPPSANAPPRASRAFDQEVLLKDGQAVVELSALGGSRLILVTSTNAAPRTTAAAPGLTATARVVSTLRLPGGTVPAVGESRAAGGSVMRLPLDGDPAELGLTADDALDGAAEAIHVQAAAPGRYRLELAGPEGTRVTVVAAEPESRLVLTTEAGPLSRQPGETVVVRALLRDGDLPVKGARVRASLAPASGGRAQGGPASVGLYDDGRHGDGAADDGLYAATLDTVPAQPAGLWSVRVEAAGTDRAGLTFRRTGGSGFMNEPGAARLLPGVRAVLVRGAGEPMLHIEATALVREGGRYRLDAIVAGAPAADGVRPGRAWAESTQVLTAGQVPLALDVPLGGDAGEAAGLLVDVRLLGLDRPGLAGRAMVPVR